MLPPRCLLSFAFRGRSNAAGRDRPQAFQPRRGLPSGPRWSVTPAASAGIHSSSDEAQAPSGYPRAPPPAPHVRTVRTRYPSWSRDGGEFKGRARGGRRCCAGGNGGNRRRRECQWWCRGHGDRRHGRIVTQGYYSHGLFINSYGGQGIGSPGPNGGAATGGAG